MTISYTAQLTAIGANKIRSHDFISEAQSFGTESFGDNFGIFDNGAARPQIDNALKTPGTGGSLWLTIPSNSGPNPGGEWYMNFSPDLSVQFGANSQFFYSWYQMFDSYLLTHQYAAPAGGWKLTNCSTGDKVGCMPGATFWCNGSCTPLELVMQNTAHRGFPIMYQSCSGCAASGGIAYLPWEEGLDWGGLTNYQNMMPSPYCLSGTGPSYPGCFNLVPNEWILFQVGVHIGPRVGDGFAPSHVDVWAARVGQPKQQLFSWYHPRFEGSYTYTLCCGDITIDQRFGKLWLTAYNSQKPNTEVHAASWTRFGGPIVSGVYIPMDDNDLSPVAGGTDSKYASIRG